MQGLLGRKLGMTQVYDEDGGMVAVTVIQAGPCVVTQRKTQASDGYDAVQLGFGEQKEHRTRKPVLGHCKKAGTGPKRVFAEFKLDDGEDPQPGETLGASVFDGVVRVDVAGLTKGRGFSGVVRRHGMAGGRKTHGGKSKRRIGAIGQCAYPARVAKGKRMPGHMGHVRVTQQNLRVVGVRGDDNLLLVRGAVPGPTGGILRITRALKG
jgi:large subunit ribosomal protein L3